MRSHLRICLPPAELHGRAWLRASHAARAIPSVGEAPWLDFSSGYVQRARDILPKQGTKKPWKLYQNYALDLMTLRFGRIDDGTMEFAHAPVRAESHERPQLRIAS